MTSPARVAEPPCTHAVLDVVLTLAPSAAANQPGAHGRQSAVHDGYRPNHLDAASGDFFMGIFELTAPLPPGESAAARVRVLALPQHLRSVQQAGGWAVHEGSHRVGQVRIVRTVRETPHHTGPI